MPFSDSVAERALIACRRRCCLCEAHCGRKMQLHHIIHHSQGGEDSFDNCIPLCLNCHDDMGYDPSHAIGRKYSAKELRSRRNLWYKQVKSGTLDLGTPAVVQDIARQRQRADLQQSLIRSAGEMESLASELYGQTVTESAKRKMSMLWRSIKADLAVVAAVWAPKNFNISKEEIQGFERDMGNFLSGSNPAMVDVCARAVGRAAASWAVMEQSSPE